MSTFTEFHEIVTDGYNNGASKNMLWDFMAFPGFDLSKNIDFPGFTRNLDPRIEGPTD